MPDQEIISRQEAKEKGLRFYFTGEPCKYGHVSVRYVSGTKCKECLKESDKRHKDKRSAYHREWYKKNKKQKDAHNREWYKNNPERAKRNRQNYYKANRENEVEGRAKWRKRNPDYFKEWRKKNPDYNKKYKAANLEKTRKLERERYNSDENYKITCLSRSMLSRALKRLGMSKESPTAVMTGYDHNELREHLESLFLDGMSWENHGSVWEIDHKVPISRMVECGIDNLEVINSLENLAPMFKSDNRDKSDRTLEEYLDDNPSKRDLYSHFLISGE